MLIVTRGVGTLVYYKKIGKGITKFKDRANSKNQFESW